MLSWDPKKSLALCHDRYFAHLRSLPTQHLHMCEPDSCYSQPCRNWHWGIAMDQTAQMDPEPFYGGYYKILARYNEAVAFQDGLSKSESPTPKEWFFITVNPESKISRIKFLAKIQKTLKSTQFQKHLAVFEQRGTIEESNLGTGIHAHILFQRKTPLGKGLPPTNIEAKIRESFKDWVKPCSACKKKCQHTLNFQTIDKASALKKIVYMLGDKDKSKKDKQLGDVQWRKLFKIKPYYCDSQEPYWRSLDENSLKDYL